MTKTLLIIPPVTMATHPYPAVPQLVTWLRQKGLDVDALDLNLEFHNWLFEPHRMEANESASWKLLGELNDKTSLNQTETRIFGSLRDAFYTMQAMGESYRKSLDFGDTDIYPKYHRHISSSVGKTLAFAARYPDSPEMMLFEPRNNEYWGFGDSFSSESLYDAVAEHKSLLDFFYEDYLESVDLESYGVIGISIPFSDNAETALRAAKAIKERAPRAFVVLGGSYISMNLCHTEKKELFQWFDGMISGEGEIPLERLIDEIRQDTPALDTVPALAWLKDGQIRRNPAGGCVKLEDMPLPEVVFDRSRYYSVGKDPFFRMRLSKGCSWGRCAFCNIPGCGLFTLERPDEDVMFKKVRQAVERGETIIYFGDDESTYDILDRFAARVIDSGLKFRWTINMRFDPRINLEWGMKLQKAGCIAIAIGLESYNDRVLKLMDKGIDAALIEKCIAEISWSRIMLSVYMIVGLPTETEEESRESFDRIVNHYKNKEISNVTYSLYTISRNSRVERNPEKYGIRAVHTDPSHDLRPSFVSYEGDGMDRNTARRLFREYKRAIDRLQTVAPGYTNMESVLWRGHTINLRRDVPINA